MYFQIVILLLTMTYNFYFLYSTKFKKTVILFSLWVFSTEIMFLISSISLNISQSTVAILYEIRLVMFVSIIMCFLFLIFVDSFPDGKKILSIKYTILISFFAIVLGTLTLTPLMFYSIKIINGNVIPAFFPTLYIFPLYFVMTLFKGLYLLYKKYKSSYFNNKIILKIFLYSFSLLILFTLISNFLLPIFFKYSDLMQLGNLSVLFFFIITSYTVIRHRLFDIYFAIRNFTIYSFAFISIYILFILLFYILRVTVIDENLLIYSAIIDLVSLISIPSVIRLSTIIMDKIFFKRAISQKIEIENLNRKINEIRTLDEIYKYIPLEISRLFGFYKIEIINDSDYRFLILSKFFNNNNNNNRNILFFTEDDYTKYSNITSEKDLTAIYPFIINNEVKSLLLIYNKITKEPIYSNEVSILEDILNRVYILIVNAYLYEDIKSFNEKLQDKIRNATLKLTARNIKLKHTLKHEREVLRLERDMLDIMGHELRSPATVIKLATYMLEGDIGANPSTGKNISRIKDSVERQLKLINLYIDIAKFDNKRLNLTLSQIHLDRMLETSVEDHMVEAMEKSEIKLSYEKPVTSIPILIADYTRIREVIDNLISNAIKYTSNGLVTVGCSIDGSYVKAYVRDTGEGISDEDIKNELFQKFHRIVNKSDNESEEKIIVRPGGSGLGLYISKGIIELHNGNIWAESKLHVGSTFFFSLPIPSKDEILKYPETPVIQNRNPNLFKNM